jgi:hypothetical protein
LFGLWFGGSARRTIHNGSVSVAWSIPLSVDGVLASVLGWWFLSAAVRLKREPGVVRQWRVWGGVCVKQCQRDEAERQALVDDGHDTDTAGGTVASEQARASSMIATARMVT